MSQPYQIHPLFLRITALDRCLLSLSLYAEEFTSYSPTMLLVEKFVSVLSHLVQAKLSKFKLIWLLGVEGVAFICLM